MKPGNTGHSGQPYYTSRDNVPPEDELNENKWVSIETGEEFSERFLREGVSPRRAHEQAVSGQIDDFTNHAATNYTNSEQPSDYYVHSPESTLSRKPSDYFVHSPASTLSRKPSDYFVNSPCYEKVEEDTNYTNSEQRKKIGFDVLNRIDSGSRRDFSDFAPRESSFDATRSYMMSSRSEQQKLLVFDRCVSDVSVQYLASPYLHQQSEYGPGFSDNPSLGKMKILCSFGGRILPRPNDGRLRYVGGETKIISIRNNLTYNDLVKKTTAICNLPHTIKYQLPGEELDVLISVSSDEDLRHMTEEYYDLEVTSKRVRIFLIPLSDLETPCSSESRTGQQVDSEYHYVAAVNGMLDNSYHRSSSKESLTSPVEGSNWNISRNVAGELPTSRNPMENRNRSSYFRPNLEIQNPTAQFIDTPQVPSASFIASSSISPAKFQQREHEGSQVDVVSYSHTSVLEAVRMNDINVHSKENTSAHSHRPNDYFVNSPASAHSHRPSDYFLNSPASAHSRRPSDVFVNSPALTFSRKPSEYFVNSPASTLSRKPSDYFVNSPASTLSRKPSDYFVNSPASTLSRNPSDCFVNSPESTLSRKPSDYFVNSPASTLSRKPSDYFVNSPCYEKVEEDTKPLVPAVQSGSILPSQDTFSKSPIADIAVSPCHGTTQAVSKSHLQIDGSPNVILENKTSQSPNEVQMEESALATIPLRDCLFETWANYEANFRGDNNENLQNLIRQEKNEELIQWNDDKVRLTDTNNDSYLSNNNAFEHNFHVSKEYLHHQHFPVTTKFIGTPNFLENTCDTRRNHAGDFVLRPEVSDILVDALRESTDQLPAMIMNKGYHDVHRDRLHGSDKTAKEYPLSFNFNHPFDNDLSLSDSVKCTALVRADTVGQRAAQEPDQNIMVNHAECVMNIINYSHNKSDLRDEMLIHSQPAIKNNDAKLPDTRIIIEDVTDSTSLNIPSNCTIVPLVCDEESYVVSSNTEETDEKSPISQTEYEDNKDDSISDAVLFQTEAGKYGLQIIENADLEDLHELGSGTYGTVFHGKWRGTDVAIKRIKRSCFVGRSSEQERLIKDVWREAQILSKIHHPNIVAFYGVVPDGPGGTLATVTEFMVDGSLRLALLKKDRTLDQRKKIMIALDAAFGMEYLHLKNIVHFDLKCDNLLVNLGDPHRPVCKVGDFGLSRIKRNTLVSGGIRGTLPWMAPELLNGGSNRVSEKVDVFSFGITMWEILTSDEPYANMHCGEIIGGIVNNTLRPPIPKRCNAEWKLLMEECWSHDPAKRPSFTKITNRLRDMLKTLHPKGLNRVRR